MRGRTASFEKLVSSPRGQSGEAFISDQKMRGSGGSVASRKVAQEHLHRMPLALVSGGTVRSYISESMGSTLTLDLSSSLALGTASIHHQCPQFLTISANRLPAAQLFRPLHAPLRVPDFGLGT